MGPTNPAQGVITTRPATRPEAAPSAVGFPCFQYSTSIQLSIAPAAATCVLTRASAARPPALSALPALKPNQPNQRSPAPRSTIGKSCGAGTRFLRPITSAATSAETPEDACTTRPPAKSRPPSLKIQPCGCQIQCAIGAYTSVSQPSVKRT